jgi:hypothetical protein
MIDGRLREGAQHAIGYVGRPGNLEKVTAGHFRVLYATNSSAGGRGKSGDGASPVCYSFTKVRLRLQSCLCNLQSAVSLRC